MNYDASCFVTPGTLAHPKKLEATGNFWPMIHITPGPDPSFLGCSGSDCGWLRAAGRSYNLTGLGKLVNNQSPSPIIFPSAILHNPYPKHLRYHPDSSRSHSVLGTQ